MKGYRRAGKPFRHRTYGGHSIKIQGKQVNIYFARLVYRCAECYGELAIKNFGLVCKAHPGHRFYVHQREVEALEEKQAKNVNELSNIYDIVDGKVVVKCQS